MRAILNEWTIVAVGQWNPYIFSPSWMCHKLLNVEEVQSEFAIGPTVSTLRYLTDRHVIIPGRDRFLVAVKDKTDENLIEAERIMMEALKLLNHTPVRSVGINFGFTESHLTVEVLNAFKLADTGRLSDAGYTPKATEILRRIKLDATDLNLKLIYEEDKDLKIHLNFHGLVSSAEEAADKIKEKTKNYRDRSLQLLKDVFDLELEEEGENG